MANRCRLFVFLSFFLFCAAAQAGWALLHKEESLEVFVDWDTFSQDGDMVSLWYVTNFEKTEDLVELNWKNVQSFQKFSYFDCPSKKQANTVILAFSEKNGKGQYVGNLVANVSKAFLQWEAIAPMSIDEAVWIKVCGKTDVDKFKS